MTTRAEYRAHIGKGLGRSYYVASTTTAGSANAGEIVDAARTENDDFWNGSYVRINGEDRPLRGGAGVNTNRSPSLFVDRALTTTPLTATPYEVTKVFSFTDYDEAIDDTFGRLYPYLYDPLDDKTTVTETAFVVEVALPATWRDMYFVEREVQGSNRVRYRRLMSSEYEVRQDLLNQIFMMEYDSVTGIHLRFVGTSVPVLGSTDAAASIHPWQVVAPGALAYLYAKGANADQGALSTRWEQEAARAAVLFEQRRLRFVQARAARNLGYPLIGVAPPWG